MSNPTFQERNSVFTANPVALDGTAWFKAARFTLIALLMAAPLAFGAVVPWGWASITVVTFGITIWWSIGCVRSRTVSLILSPLLIPGVLLLLFAIIQFVLRTSLDSVATRESILKLTTDLLLFFMATQLFSDADEETWSWMGIAVSGYAFLIATFAIVQFYSSSGLVYWTIKPRWGGYIFGPYISHNNYAGLMEMLIPMCLASWLSLRSRHILKPLSLFALIIATVSMLLSGSRGGVVSLTVGLIVFSVVALSGMSRSKTWRKSVLVAGAMLVVVITLFLWLDSGDVWKRWQVAANTPEIALEDRNRMTLDSLRMSRDHLTLGVGFGAFEAAYPKYQSIKTNNLIDYAHNDYAQLVAESGILGWILAPLSIALFIWQSSRGLRIRQGQSSDWMRLAAVSGVCGILVHSFCDFNLHIPANAAWFAVLVAFSVIPRYCPPQLTSDTKNVNS